MNLSQGAFCPQLSLYNWWAIKRPQWAGIYSSIKQREGEVQRRTLQYQHATVLHLTFEEEQTMWWINHSFYLFGDFFPVSYYFKYFNALANSLSHIEEIIHFNLWRGLFKVLILQYSIDYWIKFYTKMLLLSILIIFLYEDLKTRQGEILSKPLVQAAALPSQLLHLCCG